MCSEKKMSLINRLPVNMRMIIIYYLDEDGLMNYSKLGLQQTLDTWDLYSQYYSQPYEINKTKVEDVEIENDFTLVSEDNIKCTGYCNKKMCKECYSEEKKYKNALLQLKDRREHEYYEEN